LWLDPRLAVEGLDFPGSVPGAASDACVVAACAATTVAGPASESARVHAKTADSVNPQQKEAARIRKTRVPADRNIVSELLAIFVPNWGC